MRNRRRGERFKYSWGRNGSTRSQHRVDALLYESRAPSFEREQGEQIVRQHPSPQLACSQTPVDALPVDALPIITIP